MTERWPVLSDRDRLRASALIEYLRNAEHQYCQRERAILITFRSEAVAEWCWEAIDGPLKEPTP